MDSLTLKVTTCNEDKQKIREREREIVCVCMRESERERGRERVWSKFEFFVRLYRYLDPLFMGLRPTRLVRVLNYLDNSTMQ